VALDSTAFPQLYLSFHYEGEANNIEFCAKPIQQLPMLPIRHWLKVAPFYAMLKRYLKESAQGLFGVKGLLKLSSRNLYNSYKPFFIFAILTFVLFLCTINTCIYFLINHTISPLHIKINGRSLNNILRGDYEKYHSD